MSKLDNLIEKAEENSRRLSDLIEKGGPGSGKKGHMTSDKSQAKKPLSAQQRKSVEEYLTWHGGYKREEAEKMSDEDLISAGNKTQERLSKR